MRSMSARGAGRIGHCSVVVAVVMCLAQVVGARPRLQDPPRDNSRWWGFGTPAENGLPGGVGGFVAFQGKLVVFGDFFQPAGMHCIGAWDGMAWSLLGAGVYMKHPSLPCNDDCTPAITSAVIFRDELLVGGAFRYAGGYFPQHRANNVARWDGSNWHALEDELDGLVTGLVNYDEGVVAIGFFTTVAGSPNAGIARWDGSAWRPMDSGFIGSAANIAVVGGQLYVSTYRTSELYRWTGSEWTAVTHVRPGAALGAYRDSLVATMRILDEHGVTRTRLATWSRGEWIPIGGGFASEIGVAGSFAEFAGHLFVGGSLPEFGNIAEWTGAAWDTLGSGVGPGLSPHTSYNVGALYPWAGSLYVGGPFIAAGHKPSYQIARWDLMATPVAVEAFVGQAVENGVLLSWNLTGGEVLGIAVERAEQEPGPYVPRTEAALQPAAAMSYFDRHEGVGTYWYRLRVQETHGATYFAGPVAVTLGADLARTRLAVFRSDGAVVIRYRLGRASADLSLDIYTAEGRLVRTLVRGPQLAGEHAIAWDQRTAAGSVVARGVYFVRLRADTTLSRRVVLVP